MLKNIFLAGFYVLFGITPVLAENQAARFFKNDKGLIDRISPLLLPPDSAAEIQNVTLDDRGQLTKRNGYDLNSSASISLSNQPPTQSVVIGTVAVTGIGYADFKSGTDMFVVVAGSKVFQTGNTLGGSYTDIRGTTTITASDANLVQFTNFNNYIIGCSESDRPFKYNNLGTYAYGIQASTGAKTCEAFGNYLFLGHTTEGTLTYSTRLRWSDVNNEESYPANNYIDVETDAGDPIVGIKRFEQGLYIFKRRSIHQAVITGLDGANAFVVRPVARSVGAISKNSIQVIPGEGIMFADLSGVYLFNGSDIQYVSDPIQRVWDSLNKQYLPQSVGAVYRTRNQYWLSVTTGTNTSNQTVLVYDYVQKAWTKYAGIEASALGAGETSTYQDVLLSGDYHGNVYKQDAGTNDEPGGTTSAIDAYYVTPDIHLDAPERHKNFKYLYLFTVVSSSSTTTAEVAYGYQSDYVDSYALTLSQQGALWDVAIWDTDYWPALTYRVFRVDLNRSERAIKFKFRNNSQNQSLGIIGWTLIYSNEDWRE